MSSIIRKEKPVGDGLTVMKAACKELEGTIADMKNEVSYLWAILYFQERYGVGKTEDAARIAEYRAANGKRPGGQL